MCGIFGFTHSRKLSPDQDLEIMAHAQLHRGPDGAGKFFDDAVALGMRRLSIIDLNTGDQPFFSEDGNVVTFCNGEIFNYIELKEELVNDGFKFKSKSDIEVIPFLYQKYGLELVHKLNGMYGIVIYDKKQQEVFLIRDRLGVKPIYYSFENDQLIFASELKSILALKLFKPTVDFDAISTYLDLLYIPAPYTGFNEIRKLPSGSVLKFKNNKLTIHEYWTAKSNSAMLSEAEAKKEVTDLLDSSLQLQMRSDVPIGAYVSGGLDSSAIIAFAVKHTEKPLDTFHLNWNKLPGKLDETVYAKKVAEEFKANFHETTLDELDIVKLLPKLIWHLEEPLADAAFVPTFSLAESAAKKVKVILSGAGGDELFGGYLNHRKYSPLESAARFFIHKSLPASSSYDRWKENNGKWDSVFPWYKKDVRKEDFDKVFLKHKGNDYLNAQMISDTFNYLQDDILLLTDKMTMANSIECRVPLLDHRLVELSWKIPSEYKIKNGERKYILKKIVEDYLPHEVIYRKKEGFGVPVHKWIELNYDLFMKVLQKGFLSRNGLIKKLDFKQQDAWKIWKVLVLEIWLQIFIEGKDYNDIF